MRYNLLLSLFAGLIIGAISGMIFYIIPAKMLICSNLSFDTLLIPDDLYRFIIKETITWGLIPGLIIGFLGGLNTDATLPRGHLSKAITSLSALVCAIIAWITQWSFLAEASAGYIAVSVVVTILMMPISIFFGDILSFIEAIRDGGVS
ncbi:MAG: hypothetical protein WCW61_01695 [Patescibacteria group bacterium]|jgi:hypothetical protein